MVPRVAVVAVCLAATAGVSSFAQSDLDALMSRVLERRDENWKKLQQYTLTEKETVQITALAVFRLYGFEREYLWFPRAGFFVRSPLEADGVKIAESERVRAEEQWLERARTREERERRRQGRDRCAPAGADGDVSPTLQPGPQHDPATVADVVTQSFEPEFIRSANFLRFRFDEGQYAFVGRERMLDRDVLKIEYYPTRLFNEERCPQAPERRRRDRDDFDDAAIDEKMDKSSLVTLWVDPAEHQILRYEFRNVDMDFLPGRRLVRIDGLTASMQMREPFPSVWLPASIAMRFKVMTAAGPVEGRYDVKYTDYRLPDVSGRVR